MARLVPATPPPAAAPPPSLRLVPATPPPDAAPATPPPANPGMAPPSVDVPWPTGISEPEPPSAAPPATPAAAPPPTDPTQIPEVIKPRLTMAPPQTTAEAIGTGVPRGAADFLASSLEGAGAVTDPGRRRVDLATLEGLVREGKTQEAFQRYKVGDLKGLQPYIRPPDFMDPQYADQAFAQARSDIEGMVTAARGGEGRPLSENRLIQAGKEFGRTAEAALPIEPQNEQNLAVQVARGFGSTGPFVATRLVPVVGPALTAGLALAGGAGESYEAAAKAGASDEDAARAALYGVVPGSTDLAPIENLFRSAPMPPGFKGAVYGVIRKAFEQGLIEFGQEGGQKAMQNVISRIVHTPTQAIEQGVAEDGLVGFLVGAIFGGAAGAVHALPSGEAPPPPPPSATTPQPDTPTQQANLEPEPAPEPAPQEPPAAPQPPVQPTHRLVPATPPQSTRQQLEDLLADERPVEDIRAADEAFETFKQSAVPVGQQVQVVAGDGPPVIGTVTGYTDIEGEHFYDVDFGVEDQETVDLVSPEGIQVIEPGSAPQAEAVPPSQPTPPVEAPPEPPPVVRPSQPAAAPPQPEDTDEGWEAGYPKALAIVKDIQAAGAGKAATVITPRRLVNEVEGLTPKQAKRIITDMKSKGTLTQAGRTRQLTKPRGVVQILKDFGGIIPSGETKAADLTTVAPGLVRRKGRSLNDARVHLEELGILPEDSTDYAVLDLISNDVRGNPAEIYHPDDFDLIEKVAEETAQDYEAHAKEMADLDLTRFLESTAGTVTEAERAEVVTRVAEGEKFDVVAEEVLTREHLAVADESIASTPEIEDIPFDAGPTTQVQPQPQRDGEVVPGQRAEGEGRQAQAPDAESGRAQRLPGQSAATERTDQGEQILVPGIAPITDRQRLESQMNKPLQGGQKAPPAGGLFDEDARNQTDLVDMIRAAPPAEKPKAEETTKAGPTKEAVPLSKILMPPTTETLETGETVTVRLTAEQTIDGLTEKKNALQALRNCLDG